jgi:membrane associated rhomboid family serine protease
MASVGLMGGSFGAFGAAFFIGVRHRVQGDSPSYLPALLLAVIVVGLVLARAAGALFLWQRSGSS